MISSPHRIKSILVLLLTSCMAASAFTSCLVNDEPSARRCERTILAYMGGDNNISDEVEEKIAALEKGWNGVKGNRLLVYADDAESSPRLIEITIRNGTGKRKVLETYDEQNSAAGETLSTAIDKMRKLCPADSYGLIVWSHGTGWLPKGAFDNPKTFPASVQSAAQREVKSRSIIVDGNSEMPMAEFAAAIPDGLFDFIVFEACLMGGIEVAYELKGKTDYLMVSSAEIVSPGYTHCYATSVDKLAEGDIKGFAQSVFSHVDLQDGYKRSGTFSVISTAALDELADWITTNCDTSRPTDISSLQYFNRSGRKLFFDFRDYFASLCSSGVLDELDLVINKCVIWRAATPLFMMDYNGFEINSHSGLTTYIIQDDLERLNREYMRLEWSRRVFGPHE